MYTFPAILDRAQSLFADATLSDGETAHRYETVYRRAEQLAGTLVAEGIEAGDVLAIADWNTPTFFELLYAATGIGAVVYPVNLNLPPEQMGYTLEKADASWLLYSEDFAELGQTFGGETREIEALEHGDPRPLEADPEDLAITLFTSGTTGKPKAIRYSHEKMIQGALSIAHQLAEFDTPASLTGDRTMIPAIPMFHILSWGSVVIAPYLGADLVLPGRFDPEETAGLIEEASKPWSNMVPTMAKQLLATDDDLSGLHLIAGGSPIERDLLEGLQARDVELSTIYGGTDMLAASISIWTERAREEGTDYLRRVMHPVPFGSFQLEHREGMDEDMGEILFRAPWLPDEYYKDPEKTAETFVDGWFHTGDIGRLTADGGIQVLDRLDHAIKSGGEWIPTSVLESIISEVPWVAQSAVLGRSDEEWGERPVAVVSVGQDGSFDDGALQEYLEDAAADGRINEWWIPDAFFDVEEMPLTSTGKIKKAQLRERFEFE
ncbi:MAG: AMP-binding protein [Halodesulfurarchaeum sp.]